jgi:hypothetical protein
MVLASESQVLHTNADTAAEDKLIVTETLLFLYGRDISYITGCAQIRSV